MTLALILMWIPSPLQALLKVWRSLVGLLTHIDRHLDDPLLVSELRDTPKGRAGFQRGLRVAEGMVAILVALRTRELLGLSLKLPGRYVSPLAPAKPLSWPELLQRYQRLRGSLARIERTAQRRANRIAREMASNPFASCPLRLAATPQSTSPSLRLVEATHRSLASTTPQEWGRWIARSRAQDGGGMPLHARGPPPRSPECQQLSETRGLPRERDRLPPS